jgi:hypothetical protein
MISKGSALYLHSPKGDYDCDDCPMFIDSSRRCVIHSPDDFISPGGSCGYFIPGIPGQFGLIPLSFVTKQESGYTDAVNGASCKRCKAWLPDEWKCQEVDADSTGDDPSIIHPDACCCLWQPDPERASLPDQYFEHQQFALAKGNI